MTKASLSQNLYGYIYDVTSLLLTGETSKKQKELSDSFSSPA